MTDKKPESGTSRREFLAAAAAGVAAAPLAARGDTVPQEPGTAEQAKASPPGAAASEMETGIPSGYTRETASEYFVSHPGSDFMVDVLKSLDIDYIATNAGSSFRGLHESIVTYGGNTRPEMLTCLHEEQACGIAHGYFKATGRMMAAMCHGTVGIQHAAMALYNAWCDQVPMLVIAGNHVEADHRRAGVEWAHSAQDPLQPVRDFIKWDDAPATLQHFAESVVRACRIAMTPPMGPVAIVVDGSLQEHDMAGHAPEIPRFAPVSPPAADPAAVQQAAQMLVEAEFPVILTDRCVQSQEGMDLLVELAETLQAPVIDRMNRMNFPTTHYLSHGMGLVSKADVILGLELWDIYGTIYQVRDRVHRDSVRRARPDAKVITVSSADLYMKSNYQNFQRYFAADLPIAAQAEATLPSLIEEVRRKSTGSQRRKFATRKKELQSAHQQTRRRDLQEARFAWDASPVSTARLSMEIWNLIKDRDWNLASVDDFQSHWPHRLWDMNRYHHYAGGSGAHGVGYGAPAAVGAALGHSQHGRITVNIQGDGDLMFVPGVLWTAAHHKIPLLTVMHNNGAYHQEIMHLQRMAARRQRGVTGNALVGNVFLDPGIDYATMASSMGVWSTGPVDNPDEVGPALEKALDVVDSGEPALVDVVCQPR